jgi:hypothetical protein
MTDSDYRAIIAMFPILASDGVPCPVCHLIPWVDDQSVSANISHLNDTHEWTREQVADFIETVEARQASVTDDHTGEDSACVATAVSLVNAT